MKTPPLDHRFGKDYKLCSRTIMNAVFQHGTHVKEYPFVLKFKVAELNADVPFQVVISAPKRIFRFAHQRNRIKRICREAIRLNKRELEHYLREHEMQLAFFLIYTAKKELETKAMHGKTKTLFHKLTRRLDEQKNP